MKTTVLITGASSGFGLQTAIKCAERGFQVIAALRDPSKSKVFLTAGLSEETYRRIEVWQLDVTNTESLLNFEKKLNERGRIDVLVNNAGYAVGGFVEQIPVEAYRRQFETNFFGVIRVTQAVLPLMRSQKCGKIINVSSISGVIGFPGLSAYSASKHALEGLSESLRLELKPFGIDVAIIEPGSYQTNIWSKGMELPKEVHDSYSPYAFYLQALQNILNQVNHKDPREVAGLITNLARKKKLRNLRYPIGSGVKATLFFKKFLPWRLLEQMILKKILP
ncbi:SDR family oxidoreductase [Halobacillus rhizosphaerae]